MQFTSTRNQRHSVRFREAVRKGLAPDGGLYIPESIPQPGNEFFAKVSSLSLEQIGLRVLEPFIGSEIDGTSLARILHESLAFPVPLIEITPGVFSLELFHGPTLAFKDIGAQYMGRLLPYCLDQDEGIINVLVATSGDTGSAVAAGMYEVPGIRVVVLYPAGGISGLQEKQIATMGGNIHAIAVEGTFDDCQNLVKSAFLDEGLNRSHRLVSANSINIARWLPQSLYYFLTLRAMPSPVIAVPSGNLGNLTAGMLAQRMGLPVSRFLVACNANHVVPDYLATGVYTPGSAVKTLANAMDVGNPSNFDRLRVLCNDRPDSFGAGLQGLSVSDDDIRLAIRTCYDQTGYVLDPHAATAYHTLLESGSGGVFLATAHPAKFPEVYDSLGIGVDRPQELREMIGKPMHITKMQPDPGLLGEFLSGL